MPELKPFLTLPFQKQNYTVTEGFYYSEQETNIHGLVGHGGIDYKLARYTPVMAAADGLAISSYWSFPLKDKQGSYKEYKNKQLYFGLGYFVQIYHPNHSLNQFPIYTAYGHLSSVNINIKFHKPHQTSQETWWPVGHKIKPSKLINYKLTTIVKQGDIIGYVGDSGLGWGYTDYPDRPDPLKYISHDEVHLHFEVFTRQGAKQLKKYIDPYGIKGRSELYPDPKHPDRPAATKAPYLFVN